MTKSTVEPQAVLDPESLPYRPCVGIMVLSPASKIWVGRRADAPGDAEATWWQMPQGGIDEHEDPRLAALRELREETSVTSVEFLAESKNWLTYDLPVDLIPKVWGGRFRGQRQKWFAVRFTGDESEIDLGAPGDPHTEFVAWRWCTIEELPAAIVPFKRDLYEEVLRQFSPLLVDS